MSENTFLENRGNNMYSLLLEREPEGGYTVIVSQLPGCITYGENIDEAILIARDAIKIYLEEISSRENL